MSRLQPLQTEQWQYDSVALLRALAVIEAPIAESDRDVSSAAGKSMERLEAKLDMALNLMMQLLRQQAELPVPHPVILHANSVEWTGETVPETSQTILLSLYLSPKLPQPLLLPATVSEVEKMGGRARVKAKFMHLNQEVEDWLERTLFRFHRRSIQQSHSRQYGEN
ncbi:MAG: PilZ domain-containing protein [Sulfuricella denitrificans]|nr:PilZ domain-containing protein [Sulfuricella denitrificans]